LLSLAPQKEAGRKAGYKEEKERGSPPPTTASRPQRCLRIAFVQTKDELLLCEELNRIVTVVVVVFLFNLYVPIAYCLSTTTTIVVFFHHPNSLFFSLLDQNISSPFKHSNLSIHPS
jgi:hypothetical protein